MKISRIFIFILFIPFAFVACGGGSTSFTNAIEQLNKTLFDLGKGPTVISDGNQESQLSGTLSVNGYASPAASATSPVMQLESTLNSHYGQ